jgi:hypothetical protein
MFLFSRQSDTAAESSYDPPMECSTEESDFSCEVDFELDFGAGQVYDNPLSGCEFVWSDGGNFTEIGLDEAETFSASQP